MSRLPQSLRREDPTTRPDHPTRPPDMTTPHRRPAEETPQVWALYKEVQDYYDRGMKVPEDVTLLFEAEHVSLQSQRRLSPQLLLARERIGVPDGV